MNFIRGQKSKLQDFCQNLRLTVGISLPYTGSGSIDITCFGLDSADKLSDDQYFIFYNQPESPDGAIKKLEPVADEAGRFILDLAIISSKIKKLVFTAAIDGSGTMKQLGSSAIHLYEGSQEVAVFSFSGQDFTEEKALMLGEIYLKDVWRFAAVGQGFKGGLQALLEHFGGEVLDSTPPVSAPPTSAPTPMPPPSTPSPAPTPPPPVVSLSKITLNKRGDKKQVELKKGLVQPININLNWDQATKKSGFFGLKSNKVDLDLGCMYELQDGSKGVIQSLGKYFGQKDSIPWIYLDKDDRSGAAVDGENLYIVRPDLIKRVFIFTFIYEGALNFSDVNGRIIIYDARGNEITIKLDSPEQGKGFCGICLIENSGSTVEITKEERYFKDHSEADNLYKFGFQWKAGSK